MRRTHKALICAMAMAMGLGLVMLTGCSGGASDHPRTGTTRGGPFGAGNWHVLDADPDAYRGASVSFVGKVFAPYDAEQTPPIIQVFADPEGASGVAAVALAGDPGFRAGDYVTVKGTVLGAFRGRGAAFSGSGVTTVLIHGSSVTTAAAPPSRETTGD